MKLMLYISSLEDNGLLFCSYSSKLILYSFSLIDCNLNYFHSAFFFSEIGTISSLFKLPLARKPSLRKPSSSCCRMSRRFRTDCANRALAKFDPLSLNFCCSSLRMDFANSLALALERVLSLSCVLVKFFLFERPKLFKRFIIKLESVAGGFLFVFVG